MATRRHIGGLGKQLASIASSKMNDVNKVTKMAFVQTFNAVVDEWPVGNPEELWKSPPPKGYTGGQSRASWKLANGMINYEIASPGSKYVPRFEESDLKLMGTGTPYYFTNAISYGPALEYGHSTQLPNGSIRLQAQKFNYRFKQIARAYG